MAKRERLEFGVQDDFPSKIGFFRRAQEIHPLEQWPGADEQRYLQTAKPRLVRMFHMARKRMQLLEFSMMRSSMGKDFWQTSDLLKD